jgi:capsid assembly protease
MTLLEVMARAKWAMEPTYLRRCAEVLLLRELAGRSDREAGAEHADAMGAGGYKRAFDDEDYAPRVKQPEGPGYSVVGGVGVVPVGGAIYRYASQVNTRSGARGTSYERIGNALEAASRDSQVRSILLQIDSPGGTTAGVEQTALKIRSVARSKPVTAYVDGMAASAAYWLGSQASRIIASPDAEVGSIGVYTVLYDTAAWYAKQGVTPHLVKDGKHKAVGADGVAITEEDLRVVAEEVGGFGDMFREAVVRGRPGLSGSIADLADGRVHLSRKAMAMGLIDAVGSLDEAIAAARNGGGSGGGGAAAGSMRADQRGREAVVMRIKS